MKVEPLISDAKMTKTFEPYMNNSANTLDVEVIVTSQLIKICKQLTQFILIKRLSRRVFNHVVVTVVAEVSLWKRETTTARCS